MILILPLVLAIAGAASLCVAVVYERRMHRYRRPGISYAQATFRRDGGWRRTELFTAPGLAHQEKASRYGVTGALLLIFALVVWVLVVTI